MDIIKIVYVIVVCAISFIAIVFCYCKSCAYKGRKSESG